MKYLVFLILILNTAIAHSPLIIRGKISSVEKSCGEDKVMVWLATPHKDFQKKLLLMHTLVPIKGTFEFYVVPGEYRVEVSTSKGCAEERIISVTKEIPFLDFNLKEKI